MCMGLRTGWDDQGKGGKREIQLHNPEVTQSRSCPREGPEGVFLTRKHKHYHGCEPRC